VRSRRLEDGESATLAASMSALQGILKGQVVALVAIDEHGLFVTLRPGSEIDVIHVIASIDWHQASRVVEEHTL
jgi:hypothetical protein